MGDFMPVLTARLPVNLKKVNTLIYSAFPLNYLKSDDTLTA